MGKIKPLIPSEQLVKRLHLMADAGGMLTRDRIEAIRQAADRIDMLRQHDRFDTLRIHVQKEGEPDEEH